MQAVIKSGMIAGGNHTATNRIDSTEGDVFLIKEFNINKSQCAPFHCNDMRCL